MNKIVFYILFAWMVYYPSFSCAQGKTVAKKILKSVIGKTEKATEKKMLRESGKVFATKVAKSIAKNRNSTRFLFNLSQQKKINELAGKWSIILNQDKKEVSKILEKQICSHMNYLDDCSPKTCNSILSALRNVAVKPIPANLPIDAEHYIHITVRHKTLSGKTAKVTTDVFSKDFDWPNECVKLIKEGKGIVEENYIAYTKRFAYPIGKGKNGKDIYTLQVRINPNDNKIITAFPCSKLDRSRRQIIEM